MPHAQFGPRGRRWCAALAAAATLGLGLYALAADDSPAEQRTPSLSPVRERYSSVEQDVHARLKRLDKTSFRERPIVAPVRPANLKYLGADTCSLCHEQTHSHFHSDLSQLNEYTIWHDKDPHAQSFAALDVPLAHEMERVLGWPRGAAMDPARGCVACHAIDTRTTPAGPMFKVDQGVSCEACHGPASDWIDRHWKPEWRDIPTADKAQHFGMTDVRSPLNQAQMCLSCHLGNLQEGKFVSHEMYAAGHPPLPSFELQTFSDRMPPHWKPLEQKSSELQRQLGYVSEPMPRSSRVVAGSVAAAVMSAALEVDELKRTAGAGAHDYAIYDCAACHHELRLPSPRQARGYGGARPGTLPYPDWPSVLPGLQLRERNNSLEAETNLAPPDNPRDEPSALDQIRFWCRSGLAAPPDYNTARQIHWGIDVLFHELQQSAAAKRAGGDVQIDAILAEMTADLDAQPRSESNRSANRSYWYAGPFSVSLETMGRYDPAKFQRQLARLDKLLADR